MYTFLGNIIFKITVKRYLAGHPASYDFTLPLKGFYPGDTGRAGLEIKMPGVFVPGFYSRFKVILQWKKRKPIIISIPLEAGANHKNVDIITVKRGSYKSSRDIVEFGDLLGFTRSELYLKADNKLTVFPEIHNIEQNLEAPIAEGLKSPEIYRKKRSDELLDTRKYYPGDDLRKLNWKVFAHIGELFLRIGEEIPSPESHILCIFDTALAKSLPEKGEADYLDSMTAFYAGMILALSRQGFKVLCLTPGVLEPVSVSNATREDILNILSEIWWDEGNVSVNISTEFVRVIILSSPGSLRVAGLLKNIKRRKLPATLLLKKEHFLIKTSEHFKLKNLLFISRSGKKRERVSVKPEDISVFNNALEADILKYKNNLGSDNVKAV